MTTWQRVQKYAERSSHIRSSTLDLPSGAMNVGSCDDRIQLITKRHGLRPTRTLPAIVELSQAGQVRASIVRP